MSSRKSWTATQDAALKEICEERGIRAWSEVSRILEKEFGIFDKKGNQCRERFYNFLNSQIKRQKWSEAEQRKLAEMQQQLGNKWVAISRSLVGRPQNRVKNHFYALVRRGLRNINSFIKTKLRRHKQLEISLIYKVIEKAKGCSPALKTELAFLGLDVDHQNPDLEKIKQIIGELKTIRCVGNKKARGRGRLLRPVFVLADYRHLYPEYFKQDPKPEEKASGRSLCHLALTKDKELQQRFMLLRTHSAWQYQSPTYSQNTQSFNFSFQSEKASQKLCMMFTPESLKVALQSPLERFPESPYFDELRPPIASWYNLYPH